MPIPHHHQIRKLKQHQDKAEVWSKRPSAHPYSYTNPNSECVCVWQPKCVRVTALWKYLSEPTWPRQLREEEDEIIIKGNAVCVCACCDRDLWRWGAVCGLHLTCLTHTAPWVSEHSKHMALQAHPDMTHPPKSSNNLSHCFKCWPSRKAHYRTCVWTITVLCF